MASAAFPNGMRFNATVAVTWYPPQNMYGAVGCDYGELLTLYDDDPDGVYEDPNFDGWALVTKKENGLTGFFPEAYITNIKAISAAKIAVKPNPVKPNKPPVKKTAGHPDGKPVNVAKHAPAAKAGGGVSGCCGGKKPGKAGKKRALELAIEESDVDSDDDDDGPEVNFQPEDEPYAHQEA
jgi:hypothetical protein